MGKKRIITEAGHELDLSTKKASGGSRKKMEQGVMSIQATYNNTKIALTDSAGNTVLWSSSGSLGFKGAKKGTPFAAGKVAELIADQAAGLGLKEVDVVVKGVGAGREAAIRAIVGKGLVVNAIRDNTPYAFNGPKHKKPRRV